MFMWEISLFFCRRLVKLLESVIRMLEKMIKLKLCNDPKHPVMKGQISGLMLVQIDTLTPLVKFIVSNEITETDRTRSPSCSTGRNEETDF